MTGSGEMNAIVVTGMTRAKMGRPERNWFGAGMSRAAYGHQKLP
jgi:hypothetical protein